MADGDRQTVPGVAELRRLCQAPKLARDRRWWYVIYRRLSIYVTWALLHTSTKQSGAARIGNPTYAALMRCL